MNEGFWLLGQSLPVIDVIANEVGHFHFIFWRRVAKRPSRYGADMKLKLVNAACVLRPMS